MNESQKIKKTIWYEFFQSIATNKSVLDIGCGPLPVLPNAEPFDRADGDANEILKYINKKYDVVYSSHCLEHMSDPQKVLRDWYELVEIGGYLVVTVPHEVMYEQCYWPSIFNVDHKSSFRINSIINDVVYSNSYSVLDLINTLPNNEIISISVDDQNYDHRLIAHGRYKIRFIKFELFVLNRLLSKSKTSRLGKFLLRIACSIGIPFDQTLGSALAQITFILRKK